jgi:Tfp pilus assembly protein PilE
MDEVMIAAYERKIRRLEEQIATTKVCVDRALLEKVFALEDENKEVRQSKEEYEDLWNNEQARCHQLKVEVTRLKERLSGAVELTQTPCQCDPPGSGECCNGCCRVRECVIGLLGGTIGWEEIVTIFDRAVARVIETNPGSHAPS